MMSFFKKEDRRKKSKGDNLNESTNDSNHSLVRINDAPTEELNQVEALTSSSKSSIDSSNSHIGALASAPPLLPKPKKGILKTMSKFGIGATLNPVISPPLHQPSTASPKFIKTPKPVESTIPVYSKRVVSQVVIDASLRRSNTDSNLSLPTVKSLPIYLSRVENGSDQFGLTRHVNVPINLVSKIRLGEASLEVEPRPVLILSDIGLNILPGDQVLFVNAHAVIGFKPDEVEKVIKSNAASLELTVRSPPWFSEILSAGKEEKSGRRIIACLNLSLSNSSISSSSSSLTRANSAEDTDYVWVMHNAGYSIGRIVSRTNEDSATSTAFKVRLDNGSVVEVGEESLEKVNPHQFDYFDDLSQLRFINESSIVHVLRQRFLTLRLTQTNMGAHSLLALRPSKASAEFLAQTCGEKVALMFKGRKSAEMPPHIFAQAQAAYRNMLATRLDQSIVLMGHSGSGKTFNSKLILKYLFKVAASHTTTNFTESKLNAMFCVLNAFCCVRTEKNGSGANRFLNVFLLEFNQAGQLASILLQLVSLDFTRLVYQASNESNYLIFEQLFYGASAELRNQLFLEGNELEHNLFFQHAFQEAKPDECRQTFHEVLDSFKALNFGESEVNTILCLLAAVVHLGRAGVSQGQSLSPNRVGQFKDVEEAHKAAALLGLSNSQLTDSVFAMINPANLSSGKSSSRVSPDPNAFNMSHLSPTECLQGFCIGLYQECLNLIVNLLNRSFKPSQSGSNRAYQQSVSNSMLIVDPPGFHAPNSPASYPHLVSNYVSERLQLMFYQINFINPIDKCAQEGLDVDLVEHIPETPSGLVKLFDQPASNLQRNVDSSPVGLFWLIDEQTGQAEAKSPKLDFLARLNDLKHGCLTVSSDSTFTVGHQFAHFPVEYNLDEWLDSYCKEFITQRNVAPLLNESKKDSISTAIK